MVEHIGDCGDWIWYSLHSKLTPKEAIKAYCKEMNLKCGRVIKSKDLFDCGMYYSELNDVRAFKVTVFK